MNWAFTSLLMGFFGSAHCLVMCGALSGAACAGGACGAASSWKRLLVANLARIASYAMLGLTCGGWGFAAYALLPSTTTERALRMMSGVAVVIAGCTLLGIAIPSLFGGTLRWLWERVRRRVARLLPVQSLSGAALLGIAWGLLPCGLLYAALLQAVSLASPLKGMFAMALFGVGTLPAMIASGMGVGRFSQSIPRAWPRRIGGALVIASGAWICWMAVGDLVFDRAPAACCVASRAVAM